MDTSQRRSLSLKLDFMDLFFGISNLPAMNLIPTRKMFTEKKRKTESFNTQQLNFYTDEKFENVYSTIPKTWMDGLHDTKMNLGNYSPSLTIDLAKAMERSMQQINYMKYPNRIIDMFNSEKITSSINNIENLIYSKMNGDINATRDSAANYSNKDIDVGTTGKKRDSVECQGDKIEITTAEPKKYPNMEGPSISKPQVPKTWRKCAKIEPYRGKGRGKIQLRRSGVSQLKHKKERSKQNLHCNIQDDMDAWAEDLQDFPEMPTKSSDTSTNSTNNQSPSDKVIPKYQITDADYPTLPQKFPSNFETKSMKKIPKKNHDSPIQSPKDDLSFTRNYRPRRPSESSIDSEESYCIVFQNDSECDSDAADSDYESSSGEESEDDENDDEINLKVRFTLKPKIHMMFKWDFAYRAARRGPWEEIARDRERFRSRINCVSKILNPILSLQHREQVYRNRFDVND